MWQYQILYWESYLEILNTRRLGRSMPLLLAPLEGWGGPKGPTEGLWPPSYISASKSTLILNVEVNSPVSL